jgi:hypothetical protein
MGGVHTANGSWTQFSRDRCERPIGITDSDIVRETDDLEPLAPQPRIACEIMFDLVRTLVHISVQLHDQTALQTDEVDDERPNGMLPSEAKAPLLATAQHFPNDLFGRRRTTAEGTGLTYCRGAHDVANPEARHTPPIPNPSPARGEGSATTHKGRPEPKKG